MLLQRPRAISIQWYTRNTKILWITNKEGAYIHPSHLSLSLFVKSIHFLSPSSSFETLRSALQGSGFSVDYIVCLEGMTPLLKWRTTSCFMSIILFLSFRIFQVPQNFGELKNEATYFTWGKASRRVDQKEVDVYEGKSCALLEIVVKNTQIVKLLSFFVFLSLFWSKKKRSNFIWEGKDWYFLHRRKSFLCH